MAVIVKGRDSWCKKTPNGYVRRMAGVDNIEWLEPDQGYKIIEGFKVMVRPGKCVI